MQVTEQRVADVPAGTWTQAGVVTGMRWQSLYNVSCWVRLRAPADAPVGLFLRVRDAADQVRDVLVDEALPGSTPALLLSALVAVETTGPIRSMSVWLRLPAGAECVVDELFVQRAGGQRQSAPVTVAR